MILSRIPLTREGGMMPRDSFARRLKTLRKAAGLSQYRLAKTLQITPQAVSLLEKGLRNPSWEMVQNIARVLEVSCEAFDLSKPAPKKGGRK